MKKVLAIILVVAMLIPCIALTGCSSAKKYELAMVTDIGQLNDGGFNQYTYDGLKRYAEDNKIEYQYYQPANGADATDNDRIAAMRQAIKNGAKVIVCPGFLQAGAMTAVALESPDVKFVFVDGWSLTDDAGNLIPNVTAICYKEQESGFLAGYAVVKDGYTKLGGTFGGGGSNPACNRYAYGYVQGAKAAAAELGVNAEVKISFQYGSAFSASPELATQMGTWYADGTQAIFSCGGSMVNSVISAANETADGKVIGVDNDQSGLSDRIITTAKKDLSNSVYKVLGQFYAGEWDSALSGKTSNLGAAEDCTGLPMDTSRFTSFSQADYDTLFNKIASGEFVPDANVEGAENGDFWTALSDANTTVLYE